MEITKLDPYSGKMNTLDLDITQEQIDKWRGGELIQNAMPHLNPDQREFLMTGIMPDSWDAIFEDADE